jgi:hypothetical protein
MSKAFLRAGDTAQVAKHLLSRHKALSSNTSTIEQTKKNPKYSGIFPFSFTTFNIYMNINIKCPSYKHHARSWD